MSDSICVLGDPEIQAERTVHLCIDVQNIFAWDTEWKVTWLERSLPNICRVAEAYADRTIFTRFIPVEEPGAGQGMWRQYYLRWPQMTRRNLAPECLEIVPELAALAPRAEIIDKPVYGPWLCTDLHRRLQDRRINTLIVTGLETEVCILATISGAVDLGYHVIVIRDAVCSSEDATHDNILHVYRQRYHAQIDIMTTDDLLRQPSARPVLS